jgi:hypothetical protein
MRKRSWIVVAGVGATVLAAAPVDAQNGNDRNGAVSDVRIRTSKEPPPAPRISHVEVKGRDTTLVFRQPDPTPAFRIDDYSGLSEPQITNYMASRDSAQIGLARLAQQRVTNPAVRDFAANIEQMRTAELAETEEIITDEGVGFEPRQNDYALTRLLEIVASLNKMPSGPEAGMGPRVSPHAVLPARERSPGHACQSAQRARQRPRVPHEGVADQGKRYARRCA